MIVKIVPESVDFAEGDIVISEAGSVMLVTVPASGYPNSSEDTFWGISLDGSRLSNGNFRKNLFKKFHGTITFET